MHCCKSSVHVCVGYVIVNCNVIFVFNALLLFFPDIPLAQLTIYIVLSIKSNIASRFLIIVCGPRNAVLYVH